jgi:hypothetical protein
VADFVVVGSITGMPPRRVFRHPWRDSILIEQEGEESNVMHSNVRSISAQGAFRHMWTDSTVANKNQIPNRTL